MKKAYKKPKTKCCIPEIKSFMNAGSPGQDDYAKDDVLDGDYPYLWSAFLPFLILATSLISSCHRDTEYVYIDDPDKPTQTTVYLNMPELTVENADAPQESTRGIGYTFDERLHSYWSGDVTIGVFPVAPQVNSQVKYTFSVPDIDKSFRTQFVGVGWGLKANNTYAAYFPYRTLSSDLQYDSIPVCMTGQKQIGNDNLDNFEPYEYLYAKATMPEDSAVTFDFDRKNAIIWLQLNLHGFYDTWRKATLTNVNGDSVFIEEAYMNVSTGEITPTKRSPSISIDLSDVTSSESDTVNIFISAMPTRTGPMLLSLEASDQPRTLYAALSDAELKPNVVARFKRTPELVPYLYTDLGLPSGTIWADANLGALLPYDTGEYYSWGGIYNNQSFFYWSSYLFCNYIDADGELTSGNNMSYLSKYTIPDEFYEGSWYNSKREFIGDNLTELDSDDDAVQRAFGGEWRVPSSEQFQELIDLCDKEWIPDYKGTGKCGYLFTGPNGNSIFLPAAGWVGCENQRDVEQFVYNSEHKIPGEPYYVAEEYDDMFVVRHWFNAYGYNHSGYYWTRDLAPNYSFNALECKFTEIISGNQTLHSQPSIADVKRYVGCTIRPVMQK